MTAKLAENKLTSTRFGTELNRTTADKLKFNKKEELKFLSTSGGIYSC